MLPMFHWAAWFSVHKYGTEILVANEFDGLNFTCTTGPGGNLCWPTQFTECIIENPI